MKLIMKTMTAQQPDNGMTVVDFLASKGKISPDQLGQIKLEALNTGKTIEEILRAEAIVPEEDLIQAKAVVSGIPYIDLRDRAVSPEALGLVPKSLAERYTALPLEYDRLKNELTVVMADPLDLKAIEFLERKTGTKVKPLIAPADVIREVINASYQQTLTAEVKEAIRESAPPEAKAVDISKLGEIIKEAPVAKIVSTILEFALKSRASDVHIEAGEDKTRIRYRIDGILQEKLILPRSVHDAVVSRIKILSDLKIDERRIPQDGRFTFSADGQVVDLRVSSLPTTHGEKIVMRLLRKSGGVPDLPDLGLRGTALKILKEAISRPHGIIIVCGPTGSGKTTTLYAAISRINTAKVNIVTLEDPVEYEIPGVNQVQVNSAVGLTFASGLRSFLRQDPNIIMVGEIRDQETTDLAIQAALTGHLVFSTLHTNDAAGAIPRLIDLGAQPFLLASAISCVLAQRVARRICPDCREEYAPPPEIADDIKAVLGKLLPDYGGKPLVIYRGKGCQKCGATGYLGRVGIFEVMAITEKLGRLILERAPAGDIQKQALEEGMVTMKQDGYLKVLEGVTSIEEILRVAQE